MMYPQIKKRDVHGNSLLRDSLLRGAFSRALFRPPQYPRRVTCDNRAWRNIFRHDAAGSDRRSFANFYAAQNGCIGSNGGSSFDNRRDAVPIRFGLKLPTRGGGSRKTVIDKHHTVANKDFIFQRHSFADEGVAGDFAPVSYSRALLDFDKRADFDIVADLAAIEVREGENLDPLAKLHIWRNPLIKLFRIIHADTIARVAGTTAP
jgi:hypothetical protein